MFWLVTLIWRTRWTNLPWSCSLISNSPLGESCSTNSFHIFGFYFHSHVLCFRLLVIYFFSLFFFSCTLISVTSSLLLLISMLYKSLFQLLTGLMKYFTICGAVIKGDEFLNSGEFCKNGKKLADLSHIFKKQIVS